MKVRKKSNKKVIAITIGALTLVAASIAIYFWFYSSPESQETHTNHPENHNTDEKSIKPQNQSSNKSIDEPKDTELPVPHEKQKDIPQPYEGKDVNEADSLTGTITYSSVVGNNLIIRTTINQMLGSGVCELTLTSGDSTVTKTANIIQNPSSSTCEGFSVPTSELSKGNWNISIKIRSDKRNGTLAGDVVI